MNGIRESFDFPYAEALARIESWAAHGLILYTDLATQSSRTRPAMGAERVPPEKERAA